MRLPAPRVATGGLLLCALVLTACSDGADVSEASPPVVLTTPPPAPPSITPSPLPSITVPASPSVTPSATGTPSATASTSPTPTTAPTTESPEDPLSARPPLETAPPTGQPVCDARALSVVDADAVIDRTTVREVFVVRTTGPDCQLTGYPSVVLRDAAGAVVPATSRPGGFGLPAERPTVHTLSRGTSVSFIVAGARTGTRCVDAATVAVRLPGTSGAITTTTAFAVCDGAIGLSPVRRQLSID